MVKQQLRSVLREALRLGHFIRFHRRFEDNFIRGYVLDVGPDYFLLSLVSDRVRFDGFECFRISDVRNIRPDPCAAFVEAALRKRGARKPRKPRITLASISTILASANRAF